MGAGFLGFRGYGVCGFGLHIGDAGGAVFGV